MALLRHSNDCGFSRLLADSVSVRVVSPGEKNRMRAIVSSIHHAFVDFPCRFPFGCEEYQHASCRLSIRSLAYTCTFMAAAMLATHFSGTTAALGIAESTAAYVTPTVPELKVGLGIAGAAVVSTVGLGMSLAAGSASKEKDDFSGVTTRASQNRVVIRSPSGYGP